MDNSNNTKINENPSDNNVQPKKTFLNKVLGFRSNKKWKKALSSIYLVLVAICTLSVITQMNSTNDFITLLQMLFYMLAPYIFLSNFKIKEVLPLFKKNSKILTIIGMICVYFIATIFFTLINPATYCEHSWNETEKAPTTCTQDGQITFYCKLCDSGKTEKINKTGHAFEVTKEDDKGITKTCSICGEELIEMKNASTQTTENDNTPENNVSNEIPDTEGNPTAEENSDTDENDNAATPNTDPNPSNDTVVQPEHVHAYATATCTTPKTCSTCGATSGNANGHTWKNATCTAPKTCSTCKATEGNAKGHNWVAATYSAPKTCSTCKATEGSALEVPNSENYHGHVYTGGSSSKKYHYEAECAGKNSHEITWDEVSRRKLGPCGTCVLK